MRRIRSLRLPHARWSFAPRATAIIVAVLAVTLVTGIWLGRMTAPKTVPPVTSSSQTSAGDKEIRRIESGYTYSKKLITTDQRAHRLTDEEAAKVRAKLDELHAFRRSLESKAANSKTSPERDQKRQEIRTWAKANDVSIRYFIRLY